MFWANISGNGDVIKGYARDILKPFVEIAYFLSYNLRDGLDKVKDYPALVKENSSLKMLVEKLRVRNIRLREKCMELERLRKLLRLKDELEFDTVVCKIIGYDISGRRGKIILDKGSNDGIFVKMPVVASGGLVGKVISVSPRSSTVNLLIDESFKAGALIQESRDIGIVEGNGCFCGPDCLKMRYIPLDSSVNIGEVVVTSGLGFVFPKGLPIGKIVAIGKEDNGLFLYADIKPFVNFNRLEEVICIVTEE